MGELSGLASARPTPGSVARASARTKAERTLDGGGLDVGEYAASSSVSSGTVCGSASSSAAAPSSPEDRPDFSPWPERSSWPDHSSLPDVPACQPTTSSVPPTWRIA